MVTPEDVELLTVSDDPDEIADLIAAAGGAANCRSTDHRRLDLARTAG